MASHSTSKAVEDAKQAASNAAKKAGDAVDAKREKVADAIDDAANTVGEQGKKGARPVREYAETAKDKMGDAADYIRDTDAREMGRDAMNFARGYPVASLLILGAVVIGGSMLVASLLEDERAEIASGQAHRAMGLSSAVKGLGPKGTETLTRVRDAAFGFALAKAVEAADELWPGFREHYEKA